MRPGGSWRPVARARRLLRRLGAVRPGLRRADLRPPAARRRSSRIWPTNPASTRATRSSRPTRPASATGRLSPGALSVGSGAGLVALPGAGADPGRRAHPGRPRRRLLHVDRAVARAGHPPIVFLVAFVTMPGSSPVRRRPRTALGRPGGPGAAGARRRRRVGGALAAAPAARCPTSSRPEDVVGLRSRRRAGEGRPGRPRASASHAGGQRPTRTPQVLWASIVCRGAPRRRGPRSRSRDRAPRPALARLATRTVR